MFILKFTQVSFERKRKETFCRARTKFISVGRFVTQDALTEETEIHKMHLTSNFKQIKLSGIIAVTFKMLLYDILSYTSNFFYLFILYIKQ